MGPEGDPTGLFVKECRGAEPEVRRCRPVPAARGARRIPRFGQDVIFEDPTCPASGSWLHNGRHSAIHGISARRRRNAAVFRVGAIYGEEEGALQVGGLKDGGFRGNFGFAPNSKVEFTINSSYTRRDQEWVPDGNLANGFLLNVGRGPNNNFKGGGCSPRRRCASPTARSSS